MAKRTGVRGNRANRNISHKGGAKAAAAGGRMGRAKKTGKASRNSAAAGGSGNG